ncbi:MAG: RNA-binding protein [Rhizobiaceae bacterium]|nr:RNA-binding protein [Rhizobiaceae bacterium]
MANKSIFASIAGKMLPHSDTFNNAGARAYGLSPEQALAQLAVTGTFNQTFYADGVEQMEDVLTLALQVETDFLARLAVYAAEQGNMKDMPSLLLAILSGRQSDHFDRAFARIVTNGKMLRVFVQMMRSGVAGRKSLGSWPKRLVSNWLETASDQQVMRAAIGNQPSLADVIKMVHPRPGSKSREALYGYLIGKPYDVNVLPDVVKVFEAFKEDASLPVPDVPFQMLASTKLTKDHWVEIAHRAGWQMLRQNLNTFARQGVFEVEGFTEWLAGRLRDRDAIRQARVFPYQLMVAYQMTARTVPVIVRDALQQAMEIALENVPHVDAHIAICLDVSGSMQSPVTGYRSGATSSVRCIDVAALVAAALYRRNSKAQVLPFENDVVPIDLNGWDSIMTNAEKLAAIGGGGTDCSAPLAHMVRQKTMVDLVVFVSDNQSWIDGSSHHRRGSGMMQQWEKLRRVNPKARMVCIDIQPNTTTQAKGRADILNVGGFSDQVFTIINAMLEGGDADHWVERIHSVEL